MFVATPDANPSIPSLTINGANGKNTVEYDDATALQQKKIDKSTQRYAYMRFFCGSNLLAAFFD